MRLNHNAIVSALYGCLCSVLLLGGGHVNAEAFEIAACYQMNESSTIAKEKTLPLPPTAPLNEKCWITLEQLLIHRNLGEIILVDVRSSPSKSLPIDGVIKQKLNQLGDSITLKKQKIVLIGDGYDRLALDLACSSFNQGEFDSIHALLGGAPELYRQQDLQRLNREIEAISPREFWYGSLSIPWRVVTVGLTQQQVRQLPQLPALTFDWREMTRNDLESLALKIVEISNDIKIIGEIPEPTPIVLIAADNSTTQAMQNSVANSLPKGIVWLRGGFDAYESYIQQQQHISKNFGRRLVSSCG